MKERPVHDDIAFPTDQQSAIISQPGKRPFHFPSSLVSPHLAAVMILALFIIPPVRADQLDTATTQSPPMRVTVVGFVGDNSPGFLPRTATPSTGHRDSVYRLFEERDFARGRRVQVVSQRNTLAVDHHHPLRSFALLGLSDALAPFFAGAKLPSTKASLQSSWPFSSSSDKNARHTVNHTPCSSQSFNRRQHVEGLGYRLGKSAQGAPVRRIHKMPSNTWRLSAQGRPPFLDFLGLGNKGSIFFHCLSVNLHRFLAMIITPFHGQVYINPCRAQV